MRILITGGYGFIGGRVAQKMLAGGHEVVVGTRDVHRHVNQLDGIAVAYTDWNTSKGLDQLCQNIDVVIHTAGMNARDCEKNPELAQAFNGVITGELARAAVRCGVKHFIYCSTVHVYSSPLSGLITEGHATTNVHPYATSHLAGENALFEAVSNSKIKAQVLRFSNAYGVPINKSVNCWMLLVNDLCRQISETHKMGLKTNGSQYRDFICMKEICNVIECLCSADLESDRNEIFNVSSGNSQSLLEMAYLIQSRAVEIIGIKPELLISDHAAGDISAESTLVVSSEKLRNRYAITKENPAEEIDDLLVFTQNSFTYQIKG
jgi:UDP-glucose 4-epimerase